MGKRQDFEHDRSLRKILNPLFLAMRRLRYSALRLSRPADLTFETFHKVLLSCLNILALPHSSLAKTHDQFECMASNTEAFFGVLRYAEALILILWP